MMGTNMLNHNLSEREVGNVQFEMIMAIRCWYVCKLYRGIQKKKHTFKKSFK